MSFSPGYKLTFRLYCMLFLLGINVISSSTAYGILLSIYLSLDNIVCCFRLYCVLFSPWYKLEFRVRKRSKFRNRYNQAPHLTQDTNAKVTTSQLDITNKSQEVSPFPAGDHKASINRRARKHNKNKTDIT